MKKQLASPEVALPASKTKLEEISEPWWQNHPHGCLEDLEETIKLGGVKERKEYLDFLSEVEMLESSKDWVRMSRRKRYHALRGICPCPGCRAWRLGGERNRCEKCQIKKLDRYAKSCLHLGCLRDYGSVLAIKMAVRCTKDCDLCTLGCEDRCQERKRMRGKTFKSCRWPVCILRRGAICHDMFTCFKAMFWWKLAVEGAELRDRTGKVPTRLPSCYLLKQELQKGGLSEGTFRRRLRDKGLKGLQQMIGVIKTLETPSVEISTLKEDQKDDTKRKRTKIEAVEYHLVEASIVEEMEKVIPSRKRAKVETVESVEKPSIKEAQRAFRRQSARVARRSEIKQLEKQKLGKQQMQHHLEMQKQKAKMPQKQQQSRRKRQQQVNRHQRQFHRLLEQQIQKQQEMKKDRQQRILDKQEQQNEIQFQAREAEQEREKQQDESQRQEQEMEQQQEELRNESKNQTQETKLRKQQQNKTQQEQEQQHDEIEQQGMEQYQEEETPVQENLRDSDADVLEADSLSLCVRSRTTPRCVCLPRCFVLPGISLKTETAF